MVVYYRVKTFHAYSISGQDDARDLRDLFVSPNYFAVVSIN